MRVFACKDTMLNELPANVITTRAVELLNEVEGRICGYIFIWGSSTARDSYETWFDRTAPPEMSLDFAPWPLHYEHARDGTMRQEIVGKIDSVEFDDIGCRFEASLYRDSPFFGRIVSELKQAKLKTSSATSPHLADFDDEGRFVHWELSEVSLTASPSESRMPAVEIIRSAEQERNVPGATDTLPLNQNLDYTTRNREAIMPELAPAPAPTAPRADLNELLQAAVDAGYSMDEIMAALQQMMTPAEQPRAEGDQIDEEEVPAQRSVTAADLLAHLKAQRGQSELETLRAENAQLKAARNAPPVPQPRPAHQPAAQVYVSEPRKFWGRSHSDLMFAYQIMRSKAVRISEDFMRTLAGRTEVVVTKGDPIMTSPHVRSLLPQYARANEIMTSTATNAGDEWVGIAYSDQLWEQARHMRIFEQLMSRGMIVEEIPQGFESIYIPTEGADPTVYSISQSADDSSGRPTVTTTASQVGTDRVLLSPGTLAARVQYTFVFEEDSIISVAPQMNRQMMEAMQDAVEKLMINGDSASSANVNYDGGTANSGQYYLASASGFRKYALVTGSSTSRSGGTIDEDDFMETFALLPTTVQAQEGDLLWIVDPATYRKALALAVAKTRDVNSSMTIETGKLSNVWGIDLFKSGHLPLADTDGKVTYNAAGTTGSILCVYPKYWAFGWKRHINVEADRDISAQANIIVATMRAGLMPRGAGASTISYNLTV